MEKNQKLFEGVKTINCELGNNVVIGQDSFLRECILGDYVQINRRNILENATLGEGTYTGSNTVIKHASIGRYCSMSWNISATGNKHDYRKAASHPLAQLKSFGFVEGNISLDHETITIGNDVWIGANVCILPGIKIGDGAVIGAGGVVTKDLPPFAVAVGNPCRIIKYRFSDEIIDLLLKAKWWEWPRYIIKNNVELFQKEMSVDIAKKFSQVSEGVTTNGQ